MLKKLTFSILLLLVFATTGLAEKKKSTPIELEAIASYVGVWDAVIEVFAQGPDKAPLKMKGVEKNRASGKYWVVSDFSSTFNGQKMTVHSIVGYDLSTKKIVGTIVDHGPYKATLLGKYNAKTKTMTLETKGHHENGVPLVQKTTLTIKSPKQRVLLMKMPNKEGKYIKFMKITFTKRSKKKK